MAEETKHENWGGAREGAGRPESEVKRSRVQFFLSREEHEKLKRLGGSKWIRQQLKSAKE